MLNHSYPSLNRAVEASLTSGLKGRVALTLIFLCPSEPTSKFHILLERDFSLSTDQHCYSPPTLQISYALTKSHVHPFVTFLPLGIFSFGEYHL